MWILAVQPPRSKEIQTDPPPRVELNSVVSQCAIYDFYENHLKQIQLEKDKTNTKGGKQEKGKKNKKIEETDKKGNDVSSMTGTLLQKP